jgi:hypothetical protein
VAWFVQTTLVVSMLVAVTVPRQAHAQDAGMPQGGRATPPPRGGSQRPWRGLFGSSGRPGNHYVSAFGALFAGYDNNRYRELQSAGVRPGDVRFLTSGPLTGATVGVNYVGQVGLVSLSASAGLGYRYYPDNGESLIVPINAAGAGSGFTWELGRRSRLLFNGSVGYRPYYTFLSPEAPLEDPVPPPSTDEDFALGQRPSLTAGGGVSYQYSFDRVTNLETGYSGVFRYFFREQDQEIYGNSRQQQGFVLLTRRVSRYMRLRAGYAYRWYTRSNQPDRIPVHEIDAGVDYSRELSLSRRTTFSFNIGTSALVREQAAAEPGRSSNDRLSFRLNGDATLRRLIGRSWIAAANYHRGVDYRDGFGQPFVRDAFGGQIGGLITRRVTAQATAQYSFGYVGYTATAGNKHKAFAASTGVTAAFNAYLAAYVNVFYYNYGFGQDVTLPTLVARDQERYGFRVGLATTLPLWP